MSAALASLAVLYRRRDVAQLRLVASEAAALADLIEASTAPKAAKEEPSAAPSPASLKAKKAAEARWGTARPMLEHPASNAPSNAQASGQACSADAPGTASPASSSDSDQKNASENSEGNTAQAPASAPALPPPDMLRRMLKVDHEGVLDGWSDGVLAAKGARPTALQWRDRDALAECIIAHALTETDRRAWLAANAEAFARSEFSSFGGVTPKRFGVWLDSGRPATGKPSHRARPSTLQGHAPDDWGRYAAPPIGDETP